MNLVEFAVYHNIVRAKAAALFEAVNRGDAEPVLAAFAPSFEHIFIGQSAYQRLYRLLPDITFDVRRISVSGAPWDTVVIAEWRETNSGTDSVETSAEGIHVLNIKWGRATRLIIAPDTARLEETLKRLAAAGHVDAQAAQIVD